MRRKSITLQTNKIKHQTMNIVFIEPLGVCECTFHAAVAALQAQGHQITFYNDRREDEDTLIERAKDAEIIAVSNIPLRKNFFEHCPRLKMLSVAFTMNLSSVLLSLFAAPLCLFIHAPIVARMKSISIKIIISAIILPPL